MGSIIMPYEVWGLSWLSVERRLGETEIQHFTTAESSKLPGENRKLPVLPFSPVSKIPSDWVCVCVCVRKREGEREKEGERKYMYVKWYILFMG